MVSLLDRIAGPFREFGFSGVIYAADRLLRRLHPRVGLVLYDLMSQPITDRPLLPAGLARHLSYRELAADSAEVSAMPARHDVKVSRFAQGAVALGVFRKDELIGYVWFCKGRYIEDEVRCIYEMREPDKSVFDFDLVVLPSARMGLGFGALWHCANQYLVARGVTTSFSRVTRFNVASMRAHERLGARRLGSVLFVQVGRFEAMLATVAPRWSTGLRNAPPRFIMEDLSLPVARAS
jgi:hypothetical protein